MISIRLHVLPLAMALLGAACAAEDDSLPPANGGDGAADDSNHDPFEDSEPGDGPMTVDGCEGVKGQGFGLGQTQATWVLQTGDGGEASVHDFCGRVVFMEIGAEW